MKFLARARYIGVAWVVVVVVVGVLAVRGMAWAHHPGGDTDGLWQSLGPFTFVFVCVIAWLVWTVVRERRDFRRTRKNDATHSVEEEADE